MPDDYVTHWEESSCMSDTGANELSKKEAFLTTRDALEHRLSEIRRQQTEAHTAYRERGAVWNPRLRYLNVRCNSIMTALAVLDEELNARKA
jgi:hypothetical protein